MHLSQPLFLLGYIAILIPILIHLFNFRRYRTYYFSNVKMLQDIVQKTKRESQLKHLIVLCLRCLCILALVTAFAQPYIPSRHSSTKTNSLVSIYIDNSFSMEGNTPEGTLFTDAIENAKQIINHFQYTDQFVLFNNGFSARQRCKLTKEEALEELDSWNISPENRSWKDILTFEKSACSAAENFNHYHYYLSDFQKSSFDFSQYGHADKSPSFLVQKPAKEVSNVSIDSCWFLTPVFRKGQSVTLTVRVRNCSDNDVVKLPLKLHVNGEQKALAAVDIAANSYADYPMKYTLGTDGLQCATLELEDVPITFDNRFYFTYTVSSHASITTLYGKEPSRYVAALYGKDSVFAYHSYPLEGIDYENLKSSSVIVVDAAQEISSGLSEELKKFMTKGGLVLLFPAQEMSGSVNQFLANCGASQFGSLVEKENKVGSINMESRYFKGTMERNSDRLDMPTATRYYTFTNFHSEENIMTFEDHSPLLFANAVGKGRLILSAVGMDDFFGGVHKHALFFIPLHNIGIRSMMQQKLYNVIGSDHTQSVAKSLNDAENVLTLKARDGNAEIIPEQKNMGGETMLFFNDAIAEDGFYDVMLDGAKVTTLAFNYNRKESQLTYPTDNELAEMLPEKSNTQIISSDAKDVTGQVSQTLHGMPLWRWFILLALLCLAGEIAVLRLWGRKPETEV